MLLVLSVIAAMTCRGVLPAASEPESKKKDKKKPVSISLFIPGLQQFKTRRHVKGALLLGGFLCTVAGAVVYNKKGNDWYKKYTDSIDIEEIARYRALTEKSFRRRNLFIAGVFAVFAIHVLDVKFSKSGRSGVTGGVAADSVNVGFYYTF
jgi:hypothetical protein